MSNIVQFTQLRVWKEAHVFVLAIYSHTKQFPKHEQFGLTSQLRRSGSSIPANIVEGFRRNSTKESLRFYNIAQASLEETKYHLLLSRDLAYIPEKEYTALHKQAETVGKLLARWIQSQQKFLKQ